MGVSRHDKVLSSEESTPATPEGNPVPRGWGVVKGAAQGDASDAHGLTEVPENNVSTGVRSLVISVGSNLFVGTYGLEGHPSEGSCGR